MNSPIPAYTAAQIARALGKARQSIARQLQSVSHSAEVLMAGNMAKAWTFSSLPARLQTDLNTEAEQRGYRNAEAMLNDPPRAWQPPMPLSEIADASLNRAAQLQRALLPSLQRQEDSSLSAAEFEARGVEDYKQVFRHEISTRHFRDLFKRTIQRDGGAENWSNLAIYLDERPARKIKTISNDAPCADEFRPLQQIISAFKNPATPTDSEIQHLWLSAFDLHNELVADGKKPKKAKLALLKFLEKNAPRLADSANALRVAWNRKYQRFAENNGAVEALEDKRKIKIKIERAGLDETEYKFGVYLAGRYENINLAFEEWLQSDKLRPETKERFSIRGAGIPAAPRAWRDAVKHDAALIAEEIRGPRNSKLKGAFIMRDPNSLASGDSDQSDDLTLPLYWYDETPSGLFFGQGQLLAWIDERSWMIYNLDLIPDGAYSGFSIRNSWTNKADTWGIPRKLIHVERGIWKSAKVFSGSSKIVGTEETETGLRRLGIRFRHAQLPRGKIIERIFGSFQDLLHREPGYAGRCQMLDRFEQIHTQVKLVKSGKEHPSKFFLSKSEVMERLLHFSDKLNNTPKHGRYHEGLSPKEVYEKCFTTPLIKIPATHRHYLSDNKIETTVGQNGITFRYGKRIFNYKDYRTGQLRGQRVIAWFAPENPSMLAVTNLDGGEPFVVQRSTLVPNHDAPTEIFTQALRENEAHNAHGKELMRSLKPFFAEDFKARMFRPVVADDSSMKLGVAIQVGRALAKDENQLQARARKSFGKLGAAIPTRARAETIEAADELAKMLNQKDGE